MRATWDARAGPAREQSRHRHRGFTWWWTQLRGVVVAWDRGPHRNPSQLVRGSEWLLNRARHCKHPLDIPRKYSLRNEAKQWVTTGGPEPHWKVFSVEGQKVGTHSFRHKSFRFMRLIKMPRPPIVFTPSSSTSSGILISLPAEWLSASFDVQDHWPGHRACRPHKSDSSAPSLLHYFPCQVSDDSRVASLGCVRIVS